MAERKKPGVAFWVTLVLVVTILGYPLSVGPVCWGSSRFGNARDSDGLNHSPIPGKLYRPLTAVIALFDDGHGDSGPATAFQCIQDYLLPRHGDGAGSA
jgi:hypothetical protein